MLAHPSGSLSLSLCFILWSTGRLSDILGLSRKSMCSFVAKMRLPRVAFLGVGEAVADIFERFVNTLQASSAPNAFEDYLKNDLPGAAAQV